MYKLALEKAPNGRGSEATIWALGFGLNEGSAVMIRNNSITAQFT